MPIYEFQDKLGHTFEEIVPTNTKRKKCPVCGRPATRTDRPALVARRDPELGIQK